MNCLFKILSGVGGILNESNGLTIAKLKVQEEKEISAYTLLFLLDVPSSKSYFLSVIVTSPTSDRVNVRR